MHVTGSPSKSPLKAFGEQSYIAASLFAATGILLALRKRSKTGKGEHLDVSLQESVVASLEHVMIRYLSEGTIPKRNGSLHWNNAFAILPCKNGFIHLMPFQQWETLIEWLDSEDMAEDLVHERWQNEEYRHENGQHVISVLRRWTKTKMVEELFEIAQLMRLPWAPVQSLKSVWDCPQLATRDFFTELIDTKTGAVLKFPGRPYSCIGIKDRAFKYAPSPGEDNALIYGEELGLSNEEIRELSDKHVI
jgi:benzylsuccinate CoA-transferase BbsE subunit